MITIDRQKAKDITLRIVWKFEREKVWNYAIKIFQHNNYNAMDYCEREYLLLKYSIQTEKTTHKFSDGRIIYLGQYLINVEKYSEKER